MQPVDRPEIVVDLAAVRRNIAVLRERAGNAELMVVVKADGYGHGATVVAETARRAGVRWIGAATAAEGLALREAGDTGRILSWLGLVGDDLPAALVADLDVGVHGPVDLAAVAATARHLGVVARVHLKVDTGMHRGGSPVQDWGAQVARAVEAEREGHLRVVGVWSHLASADRPEDPQNDAQEEAFRGAVAVAERAGLAPELRHLANSAATLLRPSAHFDMVRCGLAVYGLEPAPGLTPEGVVLEPAMTLRAPLALSKPVARGGAVSYGHTWTAEQDTTLGIVPVGYAEGVPRHASNRAEVWVDGRRRPVRGTVCMDQFVVDLQGDLPDPGTPVVLFGPGHAGEPTAHEWAVVCGTINYEIVTRVGGRLVRRHVDSDRGETTEVEGARRG